MKSISISEPRANLLKYLTLVQEITPEGATILNTIR
jgi:hypothetical protein